MLCQLSKRNRHIHWNGQLVASRFAVAVVQMPSNWLFRINKYQAVAKSGSRSTTSVAGSKWCQWDGKLPNSRWMSQILMDPTHLRTYFFLNYNKVTNQYWVPAGIHFFFFWGKLCFCLAVNIPPQSLVSNCVWLPASRAGLYPCQFSWLFSKG